MSSVYGENIKLSIFGQSHGKAIGMTLDGIPAGLPVDMDKLQSFLNRRAPGQHDYATPRKEEDQPQFLSGLMDNTTCGAPIAAVIYNTNTRSNDYKNIMECPRPGHADYTAYMKYKGYQDVSGGGHFSGRLTAPLCIAGGLCKQWLEAKGIQIGAHILSIADVWDSSLDPVHPDLSLIEKDFPVVNHESGLRMREAINSARKEMDSVGGIIRCYVTGVPAGLGGPLFGGVEGKIAQIIYGIPAVKGLDFGSGFSGSHALGSQNNDPYDVENGNIVTTTNHCGGILGGITNGMPLIFQVAIKPTPSIAKEQLSVNLQSFTRSKLQVQGRHDPCIVPRAVPVVEAAAAIAIYDLILGNN